MNIENAKKLVEQLERLPDEKFWMADYIIHPGDHIYENEIVFERGRECGTVACIAGWACLLNGGPERETFFGGGPFTWAEKWLGLERRQARHLFMGEWLDDGDDESLRNATRADAITELKRLIAEAEAYNA